ncbi:hypothetical protein AB0E04_17805 [Streptomyces sp. NPDC048251]|uniref:hypothetical protein n=1 Tax=Streptomyces sp. NPDC048251 TaxID=3154501 RepID=UPI003443FB1A
MPTTVSTADRKQAVEELERYGLNPERYNVAGIVRDAWITGNGSQETWRAAVEKNRYPFLVGDMVRIVLVQNGFPEHMYGRIEGFVMDNGRAYRRRVLNPHSAYVDLFESPCWIRPVSEITPELDDFEITSEHEEVHRDGPVHNFGIFHCVSGDHGGYPPPADVLVTHKASGIKSRFCNTCNIPHVRARLGHEMWRNRKLCRETIRELTERPEEITGPAGDYDADLNRRWADAFPYLVPAKAAELYKQWKEQQSADA